MSKTYSNNEGYADPTAVMAIAQAEKDSRSGKGCRFPYMPLIFICSKGTRGYEKEKTIDFCRFVITEGGIPVVPRFLYTQMLNDEDFFEDKIIEHFSHVLLNVCKEVWVLKDGEPSSEMRGQINRAKQRNKTIRWFKEDGMEDDPEALFEKACVISEGADYGD